MDFFNPDWDDKRTRILVILIVVLGAAAAALLIGGTILHGKSEQVENAQVLSTLGPEKVSPSDTYAQEQAQRTASAETASSEAEPESDGLKTGIYGLWEDYNHYKAIYISRDSGTLKFHLEIGGDSLTILEGTLEETDTGIYHGEDEHGGGSFELTPDEDTVILLSDEKKKAKNASDLDGVYELTDDLQSLRPDSEIAEQLAEAIAEPDYDEAVSILNSDEFQQYADENGVRDVGPAGEDCLTLETDEDTIYVDGSDGEGSYTVRTQGIGLQAFEKVQNGVIGMVGADNEETLTQPVYKGGVLAGQPGGGSGVSSSSILEEIERRTSAGRTSAAKSGSSGTSSGSSTSSGYSYAELEAMAVRYYVSRNSGADVDAVCEDNGDGNVSISVVSAADHSRILQYYFVSPKTAKGTDLDGNSVSLKTAAVSSPARSSGSSSGDADSVIEEEDSSTETVEEDTPDSSSDFSMESITGSSRLLEAGFRPYGDGSGCGDLRIRFSGNRYYTYADVPQDVYEEFLSSDDPNGYFSENIQGVYDQLASG